MTETTQVLRKVGNSYVITIPLELIKCKVIDPTKPLKVTLEQSEGAECGRQDSIPHKHSFIAQI